MKNKWDQKKEKLKKISETVKIKIISKTKKRKNKENK